MTDTTLLALHRQKIVALEAKIAELSDLLRDAYDYTPECTRVAEDIAALFPDIARPRDLPSPVNRLDEVFGKWPGDEDEAALLAQLRALDGKE